MADVINGKAISAMKVAELQQELQRRGMSRNGRKSDLVERLRKVSCFARLAVSSFARAHVCAARALFHSQSKERRRRAGSIKCLAERTPCAQIRRKP